MSKKFFTLIKEGSIHLAPNTKVIKSAAYSQALDARELLQVAKEDAETYKKEVAEECEKLKEEAKKEGFQKGFEEWASQVAYLESELANARKDIEKMVIPVALKAAKKIVGREIELSENIIVDIVTNNIRAVAQHKKIIVYVSKKDYEALDKEKNELKQHFENLESFVIRERADIQPGGCVIETEAGIINAQLENQWELLEKAFASMMRPKTGGS